MRKKFLCPKKKRNTILSDKKTCFPLCSSSSHWLEEKGCISSLQECFAWNLACKRLYQACIGMYLMYDNTSLYLLYVFCMFLFGSKALHIIYVSVLQYLCFFYVTNICMSKICS